jgi:parallel beta-helix repeat protein
LAETTIAVGIFTGTILTAPGDATIEDGTLQVSHSEIITATYLDSDDGSGNPATASDAAIADCEPPAISNVQMEVPGPEPTVSFETDEPTTARVLCGLTCGGPYTIEESASTLATSHAIKLIGVSQETDYFYIVKATDVAGNETVEDNGGQCYAFTATGPGDIYVPSQCSTIQEAIDDSWDDGTVWIADGTYTGAGNRDIDFKGKAITVRSENGPESCIIDCGGTEAEPHRGFYFHNSEGQSSILDGFTITNGYTPADSMGGGIRCEGSSPTITNCTFVGNSAGWGGGLYNYESSPTVTDCTFKGNSAENWGGGIENWENSSPMINNCTFTSNTAEDGGGICNDNNSSPVLTDCSFSNNSASSNGGGMWSGYSNPTLRNCTFRNNLASGSGGGIYNYESSPTLTNCSFSSNSGNGMSNQSSSAPTLTNCAFIGNSGDGMYNGYRSVPMVTNCTFSGNGGYGMNNLAYNDATVTNCTFSRNNGGVYNRFSTPTLTNCILWSNGGVDESSQIYNDSFGAVVVNYSCIQGLTGGLGGTGNIGANPMFVETDGADNEAGTSDDNLRLLGGSACLDTGDNSAVPPLVDEDLDGNPRIRSRTVDMGAYEGPKQGFLLSTSSIRVPEGQVATFTVALAMKPSGSAKVTVAFESGDGDITVESGGLLTFKARDYWKPQTVTLAAAEDEDYFHGAALIWVSASGFATAGVSASELDNDVPRVLYVDGSAGGANDGTSWADAFGGLQEALSVAAVCPQVEEIHVAQGGYTPAEPFGDREATFKLVSGVAVKGGYAGLSKPEPDTRDIDVYETILSGDLNSDDAEVNDALGLEDDPGRSENSYHVVTGSGTDETTVLDGFTITGGNAEGDGGGGMYNDNGSPTITNCRFSGNIGESSGGGMYNWYSDPTLTNCTFSINLATGHYSRGGGMYNYNSNPMLTDCTFRENAGGNGGGMYNYWYSSPTLTDCTISSNISITRVGDGGGGIYCNYYSNPTINYCTISGNVATRHGGGIYCRNYSSPTISNCTISGNTATSASISGGGGGGIYLSGGSPMISNCMFIGNRAIWSGGGIYGGSPTVTSCIFSGNSAVKGSGTPLSAGGAMCNCEGSITNCTFVGNSATDQGGAIYNCAGPITNCIIWENRAATDPQLAGSSIPRYSCIQDWTGDLGETGNIDDDPLFVEPGRWRGDKWVDGNYHLQAGSSCIDAGDPTGDYFGQVDIDGEPRVINNRVDMGADEFTTEVSAFLVNIDPDTLNLSSQDQWITCYIRLGEGYDVAEIELSSIKLEGMINPVWTWVSEKKQVVMAKFNRSDIQDILEVGEVTLTVSCELADGTEFEGTDTIRVIDIDGEK